MKRRSFLQMLAALFAAPVAAKAVGVDSVGPAIHLPKRRRDDMDLDIELLPTQEEFVFSKAKFPAFVGGFGCVRETTEIATPSGFACIADLSAGDEALSWNETVCEFQRAPTSGGFPKGKANLVRVVTTHGEFVASEHHRARVPSGSYAQVGELRVGDWLSAASQDPHQTSAVFDRIWSPLDDQNYWRIAASYLRGCEVSGRQCGQPLLMAIERALAFYALQDGAPSQRRATHSHRDQFDVRQRMHRYAHRSGQLALGGVDQTPAEFAEHIWQLIRDVSLFLSTRCGRQQDALFDRLARAFLEFVYAVCPIHALAGVDSFLAPTLAHMNATCRQDRRFAERCADHPIKQLFAREDSALVNSITKAAIIHMERLPNQEWFWDLHVAGNNNYLTRDGVIHHNSGKTEALVNRAIIGKLQYPSLDRGYFAPTWDLIKLIAWPRFEELCDKYQIKARLNQGDRILRFQTGGSIIFRSLEVPQRIIGFEIADADVDELDTLPPAKAKLAFQKVIARCRQRKPDGKPNTASVGTTPEGYRYVYEQWQQKASPMYQLYRAKTADNPMLPDDYVESLRETYPPNLLAAYLDGEFVNMTTGSVYPEFNRVLNGSHAVMQDGEPLHICVDFNVMNMTAIVCVIREEMPIAVAEHVRMRDTESMARYLADTYQNRSVSIYPDATGGQRQHANASTSDLAILGAKGFKLMVHGTNGPVRDRVNAVNAMILNAKGERRFKVNVERCPILTKNLETQAYTENGEPEKKSGTEGADHTNDALGYFINYKWPIVRRSFGVVGGIGFAT